MRMAEPATIMSTPDSATAWYGTGLRAQGSGFAFTLASIIYKMDAGVHFIYTHNIYIYIYIIYIYTYIHGERERERGHLDVVDVDAAVDLEPDVESIL